MSASSPGKRLVLPSIRLMSFGRLAAFLGLATAALSQQSQASTTITGITVPFGLGNWSLAGEQVSLNGVTHTFATGSSSSLSVVSASPTLSIVNVGGAGNPLESSAFLTNSIGYTLTVIPEPSAFTLCGIMALGAVFRRSRK